MSCRTSLKLYSFHLQNTFVQTIFVFAKKEMFCVKLTAFEVFIDRLVV